MANTLLAYADSFVEQQAQRETYLSEIRKNLKKIDKQVREIRDSIAKLRLKLGIYDLRELSEIASKPIVERMQKDPNFHKYYDYILAMQERLKYLQAEYTEWLSNLIFLEQLYETYPSLLIVLSKAYPSYAQKRPKRSIIVLLITLGAFTLISAYIILLCPYPDATQDKSP